MAELVRAIWNEHSAFFCQCRNELVLGDRSLMVPVTDWDGYPPPHSIYLMMEAVGDHTV